MTVGYFLDLLIINAVRKEKLGDSLDDEVKIDLDKQDGFLLREIGRTLLEIADILGHKTLQMVKRYSHLSLSLRMTKEKLKTPMSLLIFFNHNILSQNEK